MKPRSVVIEKIFLQAVIVLIGICVLAFLLWEPHVEGRNVNATLYDIYFKDPFLVYAYVASSSFFMALYQAFKVLGYAGTDRLFSDATIKAVRKTKFYAIAMIAFVVVGELMILPNADELPPPIVMGLLICVAASVIAASMSMFEKLLQKEMGIP